MSIIFPSVAIRPNVTPLRNTPAALFNRASNPPQTIVATFNWATDYGAGSATPNVNVLVNAQAGGAQAPIDIIRSVKIDNLGNDAPVYVFFLDTTDTIVAPPNTIVWEPVVTNGKVANVILTGATDSGVGQTKVYFCNFFVPPYTNPEINKVVPQWIGSPTIQRSNILTPGAGAPALGDQMWSAPLLLAGGTGLNQTLALFGCPYATGFIYVTSISMTAVGLTLNNISSASISPIFQIAAGANILVKTGLQALTTNGTGSFGTTVSNFFNQSGMNLRLDATLAWQLQDISVYVGASQKWASGAGNPSLLFANVAYSYNIN